MLGNIEHTQMSGQELERYSKQILIKNIGGVGQKKLKSSKVLVIGLGGLGSPVVTHLSSSGIGKIGLVDNDKVVNAWCMPGGKIAVYTGLLKITKNTDALSIVMGHEIAHAVAKHSVERASRGVLVQTGTTLIDIFSGGALSQINRSTGMDTVGLISSIGIMNPFNRKQESEADYLGMIFSSLSGYDIRETEKIWERMKEANKGKEPPQFMSTHPSSDSRIRNIQTWLNEIIIKYPPIA